MANSLEHLNVGDKIALRVSNHHYNSNIPKVDFQISKIARKTATQLITERGTRVRSKDGAVIGGNSFERFVFATPEMLAQHQQQVAELARYQKAVASVDDLINRPLHHLKLTTEQLERLSEAWAEVKAMAPAADSSKN